MKRLSTITIILAMLYIMGGAILKVLPPDVYELNKILLSLHLSGNTGNVVLGSLSSGLLLSGSLLLAMAVVLQFFDRFMAGPSAWSARRFLVFTLGFNFTLNALYVLCTPYIALGGDDLWYFAQAKRLSLGLDPLWNHGAVSPEGGIPTAWWPIGYPVFLSVFFRLFGAHLWVGQILNVFLLSGIILFLYFLSRDLFGEAIASRASLIAALIPSLMFISLALLSDIFFTFLAIVLIYLAQKPKHTIWRTVLMGLTFGMAGLTREIILLFPSVLGIYWILKDKQWKPALKRVALIFLIGEVVLLPWQIRNYKTYGQFVPVSTHGGQMFWMGNNPYTQCHGPLATFIASEDTLKMIADWNEAERDGLMLKTGLAYVTAHPIRTVLRWPEKAFFMFYRDSQNLTWSIRGSAHLLPAPVVSGMYLITDGFYYALGLAFLISLVIAIKTERLSPRMWLIGGSILYFTMMNIPIFPECRYHLPLLPLFALVAMVKGKQGERIKKTPAY
jgi:4-amino-4-deoxy-L-arabinose transferase-like glycosyltransferase